MKNPYNKNPYIWLEWKKRWYNENIFCWIQFVLIELKYILISWKRGDIMKIYFIKYTVILIEWKYIFIFLFLQHFSNDNQSHNLNRVLQHVNNFDNQDFSSVNSDY